MSKWCLLRVVYNIYLSCYIAITMLPNPYVKIVPLSTIFVKESVFDHFLFSIVSGIVDKRYTMMTHSILSVAVPGIIITRCVGKSWFHHFEKGVEETSEEQLYL